MNIPFQKIIILDLGLVHIHIWGLMVALGLLAGLLVTLKLAKKYKISEVHVYDIFLLLFASSMIGARFLYVLLEWDYFEDNLVDIFKVWDGGMVFYGGFLAAVLVIWLYLKKKKIDFWKVTDMMAPGMALGLGIGRIGCYLIGDHLGAKTSFFLGSMFKGELRHEPALYLSVNGFILFVVLWILKDKLKETGALTYVFLILYGIVRFFLDFTRATDLPGLSDPRFFSLTISQWISILLVITFVPLFVKKLRK
ncbi:prolipoprotein diacylglyceryl transferase [Patescibacteria group bacterium]|nr:prolipoprotein diacylglyceryl transferase [Patescibacteria group bacterium]